MSMYWRDSQFWYKTGGVYLLLSVLTCTTQSVCVWARLGRADAHSATCSTFETGNLGRSIAYDCLCTMLRTLQTAASGVPVATRSCASSERGTLTGTDKQWREFSVQNKSLRLC